MSDAAAFLEDWGREPELNALEATMWRGERHPKNSSQGAFIQILAGTPDWDQLVVAHERAFELVPRFKQRIVEPALPVGPPVWAADESFDLEYHLRHVRLPAPGSHAQLLRVAQRAASTPLDRGRALWTATFVEGLGEDRSAYVLAVHHCLTDGIGLVQLLGCLQGRDPESKLPHPGRTPAVESVGSRYELTAAQTVDAIREAPGTGRKAVAAILRAASRGPGDAIRFGSSLGRVLSPPEATRSELMNSGSRRAWRFGTLECELDELKAAARAGGGSVNDAYVAAVLGGLRRYHERHDEGVGVLPVSMPVSIRREGQQGGNRFAAAFLAGPASEPDPAERIRKLGETVRSIQAEPALDFFSLVLPAFSRAPSQLLASAYTAMQAQADLTVSNFPGLPWETYMAGHRVERMFCFGALPGSALTVVLCSHAGICCIGVNSDVQAFGDTNALMTDIEAGLTEVLLLGDKGRRKVGTG